MTNLNLEYIYFPSSIVKKQKNKKTIPLKMGKSHKETLHGN